MNLPGEEKKYLTGKTKSRMSVVTTGKCSIAACGTMFVYFALRLKEYEATPPTFYLCVSFSVMYRRESSI